jgi:hypothetical protein
MANPAPIGFPRLFDTSNPWVMQRASLGDGSNTFVAGQFVKVSSGALAPYVADDTGIYGLALDASHASTDEAYAAPFGENHNVVDLRNSRFVMNITDGSGTVGSGTTTQGDVAIGTLYSARYLASPYTTVLALDASDSGTATKNIFKVEALYNTQIDPGGDAAADYNGRVIVSIIPGGIQ